MYNTRVRGETPVTTYANPLACRDCPIRARCTTAPYRGIVRYRNEAILERMEERLAARPEVMERRRESVEHPFGSIKQRTAQGAFLTRRIENVRGEFSRTALPTTCVAPSISSAFRR